MRQLQKSPDFEAPALERGIAILRFLDHPFREQGAAANAIMKSLGLPRATLYRILKILMDADLVVQDTATGRYRLGTGLVELGFYAFRATPLANFIQPILKQINASTGAMAEVFVPSGRWGTMLLDCFHHEYVDTLRFHRPGFYMPIQHQTIVGLVYLAFDAPWRLTEYQQMAATKTGQELNRRRAAYVGRTMRNYSQAGLWLGREQFLARNVSRRRAGFHAGIKPLRIAFALSALTTNDPGQKIAAEWASLMQAQASEIALKAT